MTRLRILLFRLWALVRSRQMDREIDAEIASHLANQKGQPDGHILEKLKKICRRAQIKAATVHALRHGFGAHLRMAGVSLADIADLLGHKDLATTQIYAKVQQEHLRTVVGKLTGLVPASEIDGASHKRVTHDDQSASDGQ